MICKSCMKNTATIKFTEVVDGKVVQHFLCSECYEKWQEGTAGFSLSVPKPSIHGKSLNTTEPPGRSKTTRRCPSCNTALPQILESAMVGCTVCFTTFGKEIESMLEGLHRGVIHCGKTYKCDDTRILIRKDIQAKCILLRRMLKEENYEEAARLRDEIQEMEAAAQNPETTRAKR